MANVLKSKNMRRLGFTDHNPDQWYMTNRIHEAVSFNLTINKETGEHNIEILNEFFLQPEDYMRMIGPYAAFIKAWIDLKIYELNQAGLDIDYQHPGLY